MRRYRPTRRECKAALEVYKPYGWDHPMQFRQTAGCWALVKSHKDKGVDEPCTAPDSSWYVLDSKTSNVTKGPVVKVRLCPRHASNATRHYAVTKVSDTFKA